MFLIIEIPPEVPVVRVTDALAKLGLEARICPNRTLLVARREERHPVMLSQPKRRWPPGSTPCN